LLREVFQYSRFPDARIASELTRDQLSDLAGDLKTGFLAFCNHAPELARQYLQSLRARKYSEPVLRGLLKFRGALAQAAPKELAEITRAGFKNRFRTFRLF
jgi:hypothetical protein